MSDKFRIGREILYSKNNTIIGRFPRYALVEMALKTHTTYKAREYNKESLSLYQNTPYSFTLLYHDYVKNRFKCSGEDRYDHSDYRNFIDFVAHEEEGCPEYLVRLIVPILDKSPHFIDPLWYQDLMKHGCPNYKRGVYRHQIAVSEEGGLFFMSLSYDRSIETEKMETGVIIDDITGIDGKTLRPKIVREYKWQSL